MPPTPRDKTSKKTYFVDAWLEEEEYKMWLVKGSDATSFGCRLCSQKKDRTLGDMGKGALKKHAQGQQHLSKLKDKKDAMNFFTKTSARGNSQGETSTLEAEPINALAQGSAEESHIIWALNCVKNGFSDNSVDDFGDVLKAMCKDSKTAMEFKMKRAKLMYVVNFGLFPYFKDIVKTIILKSPFITTLFDESLNQVTQTSEMDLHVRYWDINWRRVLTRYWTSEFLGHTTSNDLVTSFTNGLENIDLVKLIQISMDGPSTNWKFLDLIQKNRKENKLNELIDIGSCSLHVVHGAFKTGSDATEWKLDKIMKGAYILLHDSPARRDDYFDITGSKTYALQFCSTRWVEDEKVAKRLIEIWPNLIKLYEFWDSLSKSKRPKSKSYENVKVGINDVLTIPKLHFFMFIAGILRPFLTAFQSDEPMVPYLCNDIKDIYYKLFQLIVKPDILKINARPLQLVKLDLDDESNLISWKKVHLGFAAEEELKHLISKGLVSDISAREMRKTAIEFIVTICNKLSERNPMGSAIVRNADAFNPNVMVRLNNELLRQKVKTLIQKLVSLKIIGTECGDKALTQYSTFLQKEIVESKELFLSFNRYKCRLDDFFFHKLKNVEENYDEFSMVLKVVFILSHGQATVERGFNDNNVILKDNMGDNTVIARRFLKNYMSVSELKPYTVPITRPLINSVRCARQKYQVYLDDQKKEVEVEKRSKELIAVDDELMSLNTQCSNLKDTISTLNVKFVEYMDKAEKLNNMMLVTEGNALKRKSQEKEQQLSILQKRITELEANKKKL